MGMDMYVDVLKRDIATKEIIDRKNVLYWRKFWNLHQHLGLYSYNEDDYAIDVPFTQDDLKRAIQFHCFNEDYFYGFNTLPKMCKLYQDWDYFLEGFTYDNELELVPPEDEEGNYYYELVYNADW